MKKITGLLLASSFILAACAPPRPAAELPGNERLPLTERKAQTERVSNWEISGAMAARSKSKGWTASINWLQQGANNCQLRLFGPLGGGSVIIDKKGSLVTYRDGKHTASSTNANQLLVEKTGMRLPVNSLFYWVRGLPAPGAVQSSAHDQYNHITQLKQDGYTINYTRYTSVNGVDLPSMIRLDGHGVMIKLVIKHWKI